MSLALQVLGVVALSAFLASLSGGRRPAPTVAGVAAVGVVLMGLIVVTDLDSSIRAQIEQRKTNLARPEAERRSAGGRFGPNREDIMQWVEQRVPASGKLHLWCGEELAGCPGGYFDWITWRLSPRLFTDDVAEADHVLVYNTDPKRFPGGRRWRFVGAEPTFGLLEVPR